MRVLRWLSDQVIELGDELADVVLSRACAGCGREGRVLCERCLSRLDSVPAWRDQDPAVWFAGEYDGLLRSLVLAHKERGVRALSTVLGRLLGQAITAAVDGAPATAIHVIPIPPHRQSLRIRGRDSLGEVVHAAVRELHQQGQPAFVHPLLRWRSEHQRHTGSSAQQRWQIDGAFTVGSMARPKPPVVVVDDVVTTGATVAAAVRALEAAGSAGAAAACIASRGRRAR